MLTIILSIKFFSTGYDVDYRIDCQNLNHYTHDLDNHFLLSNSTNDNVKRTEI